MSDRPATPNTEPCWRSECQRGCYYPDACATRTAAPAVVLGDDGLTELLAVMLESEAALFVQMCQRMGLPFDGERRAKHSGYTEAANLIRARGPALVSRAARGHGDDNELRAANPFDAERRRVWEEAEAAHPTPTTSDDALAVAQADRTKWRQIAEQRGQQLRTAKADTLRAIRTDTLRGLVRMSAMVVMSEVDEVDAALATAVGIRASQDLTTWLHTEADRLYAEPTTPTADDTQP